MPRQVKGEAVQGLRTYCDAIGGGEARVAGSRRARRQAVEPDPIGGSILVSAAGEAHALGETVAFEFREPLQDRAGAIGAIPGVMADSREFDIFGANPGVQES